MEVGDFTNPGWHGYNEERDNRGDNNAPRCPPYNFRSPINHWTHSKRILDVAEHNYHSRHLEQIDTENWLEEFQLHQNLIRDMTTENTPHETLNDLTKISYFLHAKFCELLDQL
uniref:Uncharacterized protein n=1 Tax=Panagrolaimus superbus TaxID=310955 RepID=A0A914YG11_9BILA